MTSQSEQPVSEPKTAKAASSAPARLSRAQRFERWSETLSAVLLGLVTLATAWSGYQAARWGGEQSTLYTDALGLIVEATRAETQANQLTQVDIALFVNYVNAYASGDEELATFFYERFRPEAYPAVEAWLATQPLQNPDAPPGPFQMPEYRVSLAEQALQLEERASRLFDEGKKANDYGDQYILNTVLLASVLFLAGIAPRFDWPPLVVIILVTAAALLAFGLYNLSTLPVQ
ncbi:MAG: hypothetical protein PVG56_11980 [Anaerolineae bacterium]|jgi:hypothetical protein